MTIHEYLASREQDFSTETGLYGESFNGPGYHSRVANGTWVHLTRSNMLLAYQLLSSGEVDWVERAQSIIRHLISL
jgi:hypothetical protein